MQMNICMGLIPTPTPTQKRNRFSKKYNENESDILLIAMLSPRNSTSGRSKRQLFSLYDLHHDF